MRSQPCASTAARRAMGDDNRFLPFCVWAGEIATFVQLRRLLHSCVSVRRRCRPPLWRSRPRRARMQCPRCPQERNSKLTGQRRPASAARHWTSATNAARKERKQKLHPPRMILKDRRKNLRKIWSLRGGSSVRSSPEPAVGLALHGTRGASGIAGIGHRVGPFGDGGSGE